MKRLQRNQPQGPKPINRARDLFVLSLSPSVTVFSSPSVRYQQPTWTLPFLGGTEKLTLCTLFTPPPPVFYVFLMESKYCKWLSCTTVVLLLWFLTRCPQSSLCCSGIRFFFLFRSPPLGRSSLQCCWRCFHSGELVFPPQGVQTPPGCFRSHFLNVLWWCESSFNMSAHHQGRVRKTHIWTHAYSDVMWSRFDLTVSYFLCAFIGTFLKCYIPCPDWAL